MIVGNALCNFGNHSYNLKNVKNTHGGLLLLESCRPATLLRVTLLHGSFSHFLNCTNGNKSLKASHWYKKKSGTWDLAHHYKLCFRTSSSKDVFENSSFIQRRVSELIFSQSFSFRTDILSKAVFHRTHLFTKGVFQSSPFYQICVLDGCVIY